MKYFYQIYSYLTDKSIRAISGVQITFVIGFPRSGTSLLCGILSQAGESFGDSENLLPPNKRNPKGFYEYRNLNNLLRKFVKISKLESTGLYFDYNTPIRSGGIISSLKRSFLTIRFLNLICKITNGKNKVSIKAEPQSLYFFNEYVKNKKVIAVYRHPISAIVSHRKQWPLSYTYQQLVQRWIIVNQALIYHVADAEGILVKYDDLLDLENNVNVCKKICKYLEIDYSDDILQEVDTELYRTKEKTEKMQSILFNDTHLSQEMQAVYGQLEKMKI